MKRNSIFECILGVIKSKKLVILFSIICFVLFGLLMPFLIDCIYELKPPASFFDIDISKGELLNYYSNLLLLFATIVLGGIAVWQTKEGQRKTEEINKLQIDIMKQELSVAEKTYTKDGNKDLIEPNIEIKVCGYSALYKDIIVSIKNVSQFIITDFTIIEFAIVRNGEIIDTVKSKKKDFMSIEMSITKTLTIGTPDLSSLKKQGCKLSFLWRFSCKDQIGNKFFYQATFDIPQNRESRSDFWKVERIG